MPDERPWHLRWKEARLRHYSSTARLAERLEGVVGEPVSRFVVQRWEQPPPKGSRPRKYRQALSGLHQDFADLIAELPPDSNHAGDPGADLREFIRRELEGQRDWIRQELDRLSRRGVDPPGSG